MNASEDRSQPEGRNPAISYYAGLDGLRGVAIVIVLWYHALYLFPEAAEGAIQGVTGQFWYMAFAGWIGVDLFFVISGFLITSILLRTIKSSGGLKQFWIRRALRILPLAYVYLGFLAITQIFGDPFELKLSGSDFLAYIFYFGNVHICATGWQPLALMVLWSLAVEEQYYLFWPFVAKYFTAEKVLGVCVGLICFSPIARLIVDNWIGYPATYVFTLCRLDTMAVGSGLAILWTMPERRSALQAFAKRWLIPAMGFLLFVMWNGFGPSHAHPLWFTAIGYTIISLAFAILVTRTLDEESLMYRLMLNPLLMRVGKLCYGIYLWHSVVGVTVDLTAKSLGLELNLWLCIAIWFALTLLVAHASWNWLELPILKWKRHFSPNATTTNSAAS